MPQRGRNTTSPSHHFSYALSYFDIAGCTGALKSPHVQLFLLCLVLESLLPSLLITISTLAFRSRSYAVARKVACAFPPRWAAKG